MNRKDVLQDVFAFLQNSETKIGKRVYNWFNKDCMRAIIVSGEVWYYEIGSLWSMPAYVFLWLKQYMKRIYNVTYLYDKI